MGTREMDLRQAAGEALAEFASKPIGRIKKRIAPYILPRTLVTNIPVAGGNELTVVIKGRLDKEGKPKGSVRIASFFPLASPNDITISPNGDAFMDSDHVHASEGQVALYKRRVESVRAKRQ